MCSHPVYGRLRYICDQQCMEDYLPFLDTAMDTWAALLPALGPLLSKEFSGTGQGAGKGSQVSAWEIEIGRYTLPGKQCNTGTERWWNVHPLITSRLSSKTTDLVWS